MKRLIILVLALVSMTCAAAEKNVLILTERGGQHGPFTDAAIEWLADLSAREGFSLTEIHNTAPINREYLKGFDLIIQLDFPPYTWTDAAQEAFIEYIEQGLGAWIGFHHATLLGEFDGYPMWDWFSGFMGGIVYSNYIAPLSDGTVSVEASEHPVMLGVSPEFVVEDDEWYTYDRSPRANVKVLASVDEDSYTLDTDIRMGDHPVVWTNPAVKARNIYFQMGHSPKLLSNPDFTRMLTNAINWSLYGLPWSRPDYSRSLDARQQAKEVLESVPVLLELSDVHMHGIGQTGCICSETDDPVLTMHFPNMTDKRATGSPDDPDYATYGNCTMVVDLHGMDCSGFNRIRFRVFPECEGSLITSLSLGFNDIASHYINLTNGEWNDCILEIADLQRDSVDHISFSSTLRGRDAGMGEFRDIQISDIRFERVAEPEHTQGWQPLDGRIIISGSGYLPGSAKTALVSAATARGSRSFKLLCDGQKVFRGRLHKVRNELGSFAVADFSGFDKEGEYVLRIGRTESAPFRISASLWTGTQWRLLNYIHGQRCGSEVPGVHSKCHQDLFADHGGRSICYGGGWHDAGDLSQQTLQTGEVAFALLEAFTAAKDSDPELAEALLQEARWGLEFIERCRFGDGWRASSMGLLHWTDCKVGTMDDIHTVRTQNNAFDNFLCAAFEAYAARLLSDDHCRQLAEEDFAFAVEKFEKDGFDRFPHIMEHSYNSSESLQMAAASWSASLLYKLTGDGQYAARAREYMDFVLKCQQTEPLADGTSGFFFRNPAQAVPVHFIHQSKDQLFSLALAEICRTQKEHPDFEKWDGAIRLYGQYLKGLMKWTEPYGMVPSGVYKSHEYCSEDAFNRLHIFAPEDAAERFDKQLENGVKIEDGWYVRRFPVWFNIYNGNNAIILSTGKAAAVCGNYLGDSELMQIGLEQLYWTVGKNPFGQSMIFGEGYDYPQMNSFSCGEFTGEMPVGIKSVGDLDVPEWPAVNNACYKEVWVTSAGKALSLISEY